VVTVITLFTFLGAPEIRAQQRAAGHLAGAVSGGGGGEGGLQLPCRRVAGADGGGWRSSTFSKPEARWREFQLALQTVQLQKGKPVSEYRSFHTSQFTVAWFLLKCGESVSYSFLLTFLFYKGVRRGDASSSYVLRCLAGWEFWRPCSACDCTRETSALQCTALMEMKEEETFIFLFCKVLEPCSKTTKKLCSKELERTVSAGSYF